MQHGHWAFLAMALALVISCGAPSGTEQALAASEFGRPITISANPERLFDDSGEIVVDDNYRRLAVLLHEQVIDIEASTNPPWWQLRIVGSATRDESELTAVLARRVVENRTNHRRWKEQGVSLYAYTASYVVEIDQSYRTIGGRRLGPFSARIVLKNDPREGAWSVQSVELDVNERGAIEQEVSSLATAGSEQLRASLRAAIAEASNAVERELASQGRVARGSRQDVLISRNAGLAYFIGSGTVGEARAFSNTLQEAGLTASQYCQSLSAPPYENWRMASMEELRAVMIESERQSYGREWYRFIDTPDHRLWATVDGLSARERSDLDVLRRQGRQTERTVYFIMTTDTAEHGRSRMVIAEGHQISEGQPFGLAWRGQVSLDPFRVICVSGIS